MEWEPEVQYRKSRFERRRSCALRKWWLVDCAHPKADDACFPFRTTSSRCATTFKEAFRCSYFAGYSLNVQEHRSRFDGYLWMISPPVQCMSLPACLFGKHTPSANSYSERTLGELFLCLYSALRRANWWTSSINLGRCWRIFFTSKTNSVCQLVILDAWQISARFVSSSSLDSVCSLRLRLAWRLQCWLFECAKCQWLQFVGHSG